ncbi:MAG TPA: hypothetical protein VHJ20_12945, partial [Polyangia bacterium]|nr:hypothetical protein [Polyangia bacterium]
GGVGGAGGGGADGGLGGAGGGNDGSAGGGSTGACTTPETTFGNIAQGDSNAGFTSGVATRSGDTLWVIDGYSGPAPTDGGVDAGADGGTPPSTNWIYAQPFDPTTGASLAPAAPVVQLSDGLAFTIADVAVAPTGEIALVTTRGTPSDASTQAIFGVFFKPTAPAAGDAGAATPSLTFVRAVQLESITSGIARVIWSGGSQAFVFSWKYAAAGWFARLRRFTPAGTPAGGDAASIASPSGTIETTQWQDCDVGSAAAYLGVACRQPYDGHVFLEVLDGDGQQVGPYVRMGDATESSWAATGGTSAGFVVLADQPASVAGTFVPLTGMQSITNDAGPPDDAGADGGADAAPAPRFLEKTFSFPSTARTGKIASDDSGGAGGLGVAMLETSGASFLYVNADASKQLNGGTVLSSAQGGEVSITNYRGSYTLSLFESTKRATQAAVSSCAR